jgi:hypothetical protein
VTERLHDARGAVRLRDSRPTVPRRAATSPPAAGATCAPAVRQATATSAIASTEASCPQDRVSVGRNALPESGVSHQAKSRFLSLAGLQGSRRKPNWRPEGTLTHSAPAGRQASGRPDFLRGTDSLRFSQAEGIYVVDTTLPTVVASPGDDGATRGTQSLYSFATVRATAPERADPRQTDRSSQSAGKGASAPWRVTSRDMTVLPGLGVRKGSQSGLGGRRGASTGSGVQGDFLPLPLWRRALLGGPRLRAHDEREPVGLSPGVLARWSRPWYDRGPADYGGRDLGGGANDGHSRPSRREKRTATMCGGRLNAQLRARRGAMVHDGPALGSVGRVPR